MSKPTKTSTPKTNDAEEARHFFSTALCKHTPKNAKLVAHFDARLAWLLLSVAADPETHPETSGVYVEHSCDGVFLTAASDTMQACYNDMSGWTAFSFAADFTNRMAQIASLKRGNPWPTPLLERHIRNARAAVFEHDDGLSLVVASPGAILIASDEGMVRKGAEPPNSFRLRVADANPDAFGVSRDDLVNITDAADAPNVLAVKFNNGLFEVRSEDRCFIGFCKPVQR